MAAIVFPREGNSLWPLPADYPTLTGEGQRLARVNACSITGRPELDVAAWQCFREFYLIPEDKAWYKTTFTPSPQAHSQWVYDWARYDRLVHAAPRGTCKTTVNLEDIARKILCFPHWECVLFLSTIRFCGDRLGRLMDLCIHNPLIHRDFGKVKGKIWNRASEMQLKNGSRVQVFPIKGASLGTRPSGLIVLDDVEKSDDQVLTPSALREMMREFFFNAIYPMSQSPGHSIPIRIIGTLYNRRMFIHWLYTTDDPRIAEFWKRTLMSVEDLDWDVMGPEWQAAKVREIGQTAFDAQYRNAPGTASERMLDIHPELCTYWLEGTDAKTYEDPFDSRAILVTHQLRGWEKQEKPTDPQIPIASPLRRGWSQVVGEMNRFITVDWAPTTSPDSDYSVIHVMGVENSDEHRDTLYSLDVMWGRWRPEELLRLLYRMAVKWRVSLVGVEAYPVLAEFYERVRDDLPSMFKTSQDPPRVMALKFPPSVSKEAKIMGLEWRFVQFRVKLPLDRRESNPGIGRLFWEIENATEDLALLDHDDVVDSLAMHQAIGKPHRAVAADVVEPLTAREMILDGQIYDEETGVSALSGINASELTRAMVDKLRQARYEEIEEEFGEDWDEQPDLDYMGLPPGFPY